MLKFFSDIKKIFNLSSPSETVLEVDSSSSQPSHEKKLTSLKNGIVLSDNKIYYMKTTAYFLGNSMGFAEIDANNLLQENPFDIQKAILLSTIPEANHKTLSKHNWESELEDDFYTDATKAKEAMMENAFISTRRPELIDKVHSVLIEFNCSLEEIKQARELYMKDPNVFDDKDFPLMISAVALKFYNDNSTYQTVEFDPAAYENHELIERSTFTNQ